MSIVEMRASFRKDCVEMPVSVDALPEVRGLLFPMDCKKVSIMVMSVFFVQIRRVYGAGDDLRSPRFGWTFS